MRLHDSPDPAHFLTSNDRSCGERTESPRYVVDFQAPPSHVTWRARFINDEVETAALAGAPLGAIEIPVAWP
jgi:hypothetical protein